MLRRPPAKPSLRSRTTRMDGAMRHGWPVGRPIASLAAGGELALFPAGWAPGHPPTAIRRLQSFSRTVKPSRQVPKNRANHWSDWHKPRHHPTLSISPGRSGVGGKPAPMRPRPSPSFPKCASNPCHPPALPLGTPHANLWRCRSASQGQRQPDNGGFERA